MVVQLASLAYRITPCRLLNCMRYNYKLKQHRRWKSSHKKHKNGNAEVSEETELVFLRSLCASVFQMCFKSFFRSRLIFSRSNRSQFQAGLTANER